MKYLLITAGLILAGVFVFHIVILHIFIKEVYTDWSTDKIFKVIEVKRPIERKKSIGDNYGAWGPPPTFKTGGVK